ncbi:AbrB/MazE/SpoVT family DNA-binding domain-containing protein [Kutzneria viridogrisea]|uniref:SpoVT-AbrB domain-containing protein n=2 Tax=Kutzneria TaxID=43356 RepID=W5W9S9_9PSEU|nr:AbrB/MazE/SpoVT family DNA-binding domain-containing protein [Kutzneria albida]AHH94964.1 hypothetical protein KALB_1592 [Kutzneria albida DSM 43870]MBA8927681.1 AbrB family looped-hinge helix DNA binding protein [Kutzneria viridogrisea]
MHSYRVKLTSKGEVTVPIEIREQYGLHPGDEVEFVSENGEIRLVKSAKQPSRGRRIAESLLGKGDVPMTTEEIMALTRGE